MVGMSRRHGRSRARRVFQLVMLLLAVVSLSGLGPDVLQRSHCAQHEVSAHAAHTPAVQHPGQAPEGATWRAHDQHDCPHCPASECARVSPCSSSTFSVLSPRAIELAGFLGHRVAVRPVRDRADSATSSPVNPPPQLIA